ncbi:MAG: 30S ribosomal protein S12 methylthiotransferase RimO [Syntrophomonas sp.]|uniref:30S ribosomal protein S12 methylthiotransferase RimO n=1 Tax=Syntrophomonas sp. TaxID=2053627 RepID=UPI002624860D|nr:30S ribosomal protein S12 methylthiotransferase RimO [Syntrophomonas sp.]MDD2509698.1 30S ribosomal protein S12 methylthiotransferase RimO [Syntrophomonas sp.]MDD4625830.1 30S ribosomal protein S12 methylthiotransferase RimO [Syntrophomonas sp.]
MNIGFISLGCSKNQVDTEVMMATLKKAGHKIVNSLERADLVIVNTCGFITPAKEESIEAIIETGELKKTGSLQYLIAAGCLSQRYGRDLLTEIPELDGVFGISSLSSIAGVVERVVQGERVSFMEAPPLIYSEKGPRMLSTPPGSAYLKISEGCNNSCAYCVIPSIRGRLRSRPLEELLDETAQLLKMGVKELVLVAQDTSAYGHDISPRTTLPMLLRELSSIDGLEWIRLMYLHPLYLSDDIIDTIAKESKVLPYLDIPIQHASSRILKQMHRQHDNKHLRMMISKLRARIPNLALRTTVMLGFPGEEQKDFAELYEFVAESQFDWLGAFCFVPEEGSEAALMPEQIEDKIKVERRDKILRLQQKITRQKNLARINSREKVLISSQLSKNLYAGRTYFQAPEVDGLTLVKTESKLAKGSFVDVQLVGVRNYDMIGEYQ